MKIIVLVEKTENGSYVVCAQNIETYLIGKGGSVMEAKKEFLSSYVEILASHNESGKSFPAELKNVQFEYKYDMSSFFNDFDFINVSQFAKRIGINPSLMRQYKSKSTYISQKQKKKIEVELHKFAKDLQEVTL